MCCGLLCQQNTSFWLLAGHFSISLSFRTFHFVQMHTAVNSINTSPSSFFSSSSVALKVCARRFQARYTSIPRHDAIGRQAMHLSHIVLQSDRRCSLLSGRTSTLHELCSSCKPFFEGAWWTGTLPRQLVSTAKDTFIIVSGTV